MEITAAYEAVLTLDGPLQVVSDSTYVVNCFRDRWWEGWIRRGWTNSKKAPVANRDLWEPLLELVLTRADISFSWVKGHSGDVMNDLVDRLAVEAALAQVGRSGVGSPEESEAPAPASSTRSRDGRLPAGRLVLVTGHLPEDLGGYDDNPVAADVRDRIGQALAGLVNLDGHLHVVSGLRLGAEQLGAAAALDRGIPLVVVLPFPDPDAPWPPASRARFADLVAAATTVVTLDRKRPASNALAGAGLARRDAWLARQVDSAIVVWNHDDEQLGRTVQALESALGADQVYLIHP